MKMIRFFQIAFLILLAAGAQPAASAVWMWSQTASTNAGADPTINWAEGMSPSSINDSARAMMAALARWRDDISGANITGGSATAYTLTSNEGGMGSPLNGQMIAFTPHVSNAGGPTLAIDGGTGHPIVISDGVQVPSGTLVAFTPYRARYNSGATAWYLEAVYGNPYNVALGGYLLSSTASPPNSSFVDTNGGCISRSTYSAYFALVGETYGACNGTTTFAVPDTRGRVLANLDGGTGRLTNSVNGCGTTFNSLGVTCGNQSQTLDVTQIPPITPSGTVTSTLLSGNASTPIHNWVTGGGGSTDTTHLSTASNLGSDAGTFNSSVTGTITSTYVGSTFGSGAPHPNVQPTLGIKVFVRII